VIGWRVELISAVFMPWNRAKWQKHSEYAAAKEMRQQAA